MKSTQASATTTSQPAKGEKSQKSEKTAKKADAKKEAVASAQTKR